MELREMAIAWGPPSLGLRFGFVVPRTLEVGSHVVLELVVENLGSSAVWVFGFRPGYPRSMRVSPAKVDRPWVQVSFGDDRVLHPPEAFTRVEAGQTLRTRVDLTFAFDPRIAGHAYVRFAYSTVRGVAGLRAFSPPAPVLTELVRVDLVASRSLRAAGIDAHTEAELDQLLTAGSPVLVDRLRPLGAGGIRWLVRRFAWVTRDEAMSRVGWRALEFLELTGPACLPVLHEEAAHMPEAEHALAFASAWVRFRFGERPSDDDLPFTTLLEEAIRQPDRRGNLVIAWTPWDAPRLGSLRVELVGTGDRIVVQRFPGAAVPMTRRTTIPSAQLTALLDTCRMSGVWLLRPIRTQPAEDEPHAALEIQLALGDPAARRVALLQSEWQHGPGFRVAELLRRIVADVAR